MGTLNLPHCPATPTHGGNLGRAAGLAFLKRKLLRSDRDPEVSEEAATAQREALTKYYVLPRDVTIFVSTIASAPLGCSPT